jgi:two-component system cell cycle response regulator
LDIPDRNDEIARTFERIEADLTACGSAVELCETLLSAIETEFAVPFVWLTLLKLPETAKLRKELETSALLRDRLNSLSPSTFREIVPDSSAPTLAGGDLKLFFRLLPPSRKYFLRSLAVSPLTLHGRLIGSLNHGDALPGRYEPSMDTTLLNHLVQHVSERLSSLMSPLIYPI